MRSLFTIVFILSCLAGSAQKIIYSDVIKEDNREISFEILGKVASNYVVYKFVRWKHMLATYNEDMKLIDNNRLTFIPDKTFNVDFIVYPEYFFMVYQYQKNNTIWCKAVKMDGKGNKLSEPITLDSSRIGLVADKKIYNTVYSEDKKRVLVYKMQRKNDKLTIVTKLYDPELNLIDSAREVVPFDERKDVYSDLVVANNGSIIFAKEYKTGWRENIVKLEMVVKEPNVNVFSLFEIPLQDKYIDEVKIKIDNLNKRYIINSLYSKSKSGGIDGLFTTFVQQDNYKQVRTAFNLFSDTLRAKINSSGSFSTAFDNLFLRNTIVKKDGGFVITAEDYYSQTSNANNVFRRYNSLYSSPYSSNYDYYLNSPAYYGFYRPYNSVAYAQRIKYFYDDIVIMDVDSLLNLKWNTIIHKKQEDEEQDNFLSFATFNAGGEIHFLFSSNRKKQVVNNHSILPGGQVKRYATLKSYEAGYEFMPKLAKQVGARQVIVPCLYRGSVAFAKIDFSEG
jgi:hypothetical protein